MTIRFVSLNLNHRTRPLPIECTLIEVLAGLQPDIVVFNEYVDQGSAREVKAMLAAAGFKHQAVSDSDEYTPGRWHNQILIASNAPILSDSVPTNGPDEMAATNTLTVQTHGMTITGLRVPAYKSAAKRYAYWEWMNDNLEGDVAIGDFNADPARSRKRDRVLQTLVEIGGWSRIEIDGDWSYKGNNGSTSRVDHILTRRTASAVSARYVTEAIAPKHTDHAALLAEVDFP